jgi:hypothetical protein
MGDIEQIAQNADKLISIIQNIKEMHEGKKRSNQPE